MRSIGQSCAVSGTLFFSSPCLFNPPICQRFSVIFSCYFCLSFSDVRTDTIAVNGRKLVIMAEGKQIRLFLIDGTFSGLVTAEIMNWTGHVFKGSRSELGRIYQREEAQRTGVYILLGDKSDGSPLAYIGESDNIASRLKQHAAKKSFWSEVVFVTSKDGNLTSAHARYIEAQLIQRAKEIGRIPLENGNEPTGGADLPEADASDMNHFIKEFLTILPVLGVEVFRGRSSKWDDALKAGEELQYDSPIFQVSVKKHGGTAYGQIIDGEFTVLKGSAIAAEVTRKDNVVESTRRQFELRKHSLTQCHQAA